jgi:hypothetical protein
MEATLGFAIDSSPIKAAVTEMDRLSASAARVDQAANRLEANMEGVTAAVTAFRKPAGGAASDVERVGRSFGSQDSHVAAFRAEIERLTVKFSPLDAAAKRYESTLGEIRRAQQYGIIDTRQMTMLIDQERLAYDKLTAAATGASVAMKAANGNRPMGGSTGGRAPQVGNISYQLQDIISTAQYGNPLTIALQQAPQLNDALGSGNGLTGTLKGLGAAFASVLSPQSLLVTGFVAAGAAALKYGLDATTGAKEADEALKLHARVIRDVDDAYGDASDGLKNYLKRSGTELEAAAREDAKNLKTAYKDAMSDFVFDIVPSGGLLGRAAFDPKFEPLKKEITDLADVLKSGGIPNMSAFRELVDRKVQEHPELGDLRDKLFNLGTAASDAERDMNAANRRIGILGGAARAQAEGVNALSSALRELSGISLPDLTQIEQAARAYERAKNAGRNRDDRDDAYRQYQDALARIEKMNPTVINPDGRRTTVPLPSARPNIELEGLPGASKQQSNYDRAIEGAKLRIQQTKLETDTIGQSGIAADALRFKLNLLHDAQDKGQQVTADQRKEIDALAESYRQAAEAASSAKFGADMAFNWRQLRRTADEQQIASQLRQYGQPDNLNSPQALELKSQQQYGQTKEAITGFFTNFEQSLVQNGGKMGDALGRAVLSAICGPEFTIELTLSGDTP